MNLPDYFWEKKTCVLTFSGLDCLTNSKMSLIRESTRPRSFWGNLAAATSVTNCESSSSAPWHCTTKGATVSLKYAKAFSDSSSERTSQICNYICLGWKIFQSIPFLKKKAFHRIILECGRFVLTCVLPLIT